MSKKTSSDETSLRIVSDESMFRALCAFPAATVQGKQGMTREQEKEAWNRAQRTALDKCMDFFLTTRNVKPYPMYAVDPDRAYLDLCRRKGTKPDIDNAIDELNDGYKDDGLLFLPQKAKGCSKTDDRKPSRIVHAYAYSVANPDGYFSKYLFPIYHAFGGVSTKSSKLCHRSYGNYHDMLEIGEVGWSACYLPSVLFMSWDEKASEHSKTSKRKYDIIERSLEDVSMDDDKWAELVSDVLSERVGNHGIVAMVECRL